MKTIEKERIVLFSLKTLGLLGMLKLITRLGRYLLSSLRTLNESWCVSDMNLLLAILRRVKI
jgi:hypothetical protein